MTYPKLPSISDNEEKSANIGDKSDAVIFTREIDTGAELVARYVGELDAAEALKIRHVHCFDSSGIWLTLCKVAKSIGISYLSCVVRFW